MSYYDLLVAKWATLSGTTAEKIAAVNALTVPGPNVPVPILQVMTYLRSNNLWMGIKAATATSPGAAAAVDYETDLRTQTLDMSLPIVQAMLADLVAKALLTQAQADAIKAMGLPLVPWWQATTAQGGGGLSGPVSLADLAPAGNLT